MVYKLRRVWATWDRWIALFAFRAAAAGRHHLPPRRARTLMIERAVHLPPRADGSLRSLSACAVAFALSSVNSDRISLSAVPAHRRFDLPPRCPAAASRRCATVRLKETQPALVAPPKAQLAIVQLSHQPLHGAPRGNQEAANSTASRSVAATLARIMSSLPRMPSRNHQPGR